MTTQKEIEAAILLARAVADAIRELGSVPSGHLYARLMDKVNISTYNSLIELLKRSKLVKEENHLLTWIG